MFCHPHSDLSGATFNSDKSVECHSELCILFSDHGTILSYGTLQYADAKNMMEPCLILDHR